MGGRDEGRVSLTLRSGAATSGRIERKGRTVSRSRNPAQPNPTRLGVSTGARGEGPEWAWRLDSPAMMRG